VFREGSGRFLEADAPREIDRGVANFIAAGLTSIIAGGCTHATSPFYSVPCDALLCRPALLPQGGPVRSRESHQGEAGRAADTSISSMRSSSGSWMQA